jgi:hypothetical protein
MKKIALFVLTALAVTALVLALSPVSVRAERSVFPTGTYTTTITAEDVAKYELPSPYPEILVGDWEMIFGEDGSWEIANLTTGQSGQGSYFTNQTVLVFGKDSGELNCPSPAYAVYKWAASEDILTLALANDHSQSDRCWGRYIVNTSHPLVKQP